MRFCALLGLFLLRGFFVTAAPPLTVAVYDFKDVDRGVGNYGAKISTLVTANLTGETNLVLLERAELQRALGEQATGLSGMVNADTAAKIGQLTGAKVLISGQVMKMPGNRLIIVANIIGTATGRLFVVKAEGVEENVVDMTADLSRQLAEKIRGQAADFEVATQTHEEFLDRIVRSVTGTNRPLVSVGIHWPQGPNRPSAAANIEMGLLLQKAGFVVVDGRSERKPDVEITGTIATGGGPKRGELFSCHAVLEAKIQARETGRILALDRQTAEAVDVSRLAADHAAQAKAVDELAERILPILAK